MNGRDLPTMREGWEKEDDWKKINFKRQGGRRASSDGPIAPPLEAPLRPRNPWYAIGSVKERRGSPCSCCQRRAHVLRQGLWMDFDCTKGILFSLCQVLIPSLAFPSIERERSLQARTCNQQRYVLQIRTGRRTLGSNRAGRVTVLLCSGSIGAVKFGKYFR